MTAFVVLVALLLSVAALVRLAGAERRVQEAERRVNLLRQELLELRMVLGLPPSARLGAVPQREQAGAAPSELPQSAQAVVPTSNATHSARDSGPLAAPSVPPVAPSGQLAPAAPASRVWPEDLGHFGPEVEISAAPPSSSGGPASRPATATPSLSSSLAPSLWAAEFSQARISIFGGALVLGGLAFTLRALGLPDWTLLLAVFAFGGLLYVTARLVPWPVSGALRGLGYGVTALGLGSLAQKLPVAWGPGAVLLGLLALSMALSWDSLRRREPLLGVMAVAGASLSVWMLADDIGRWSVLALAAVFLLAVASASALFPHLRAAPGTGSEGKEFSEAGTDAATSELSPDHPRMWRAALTLVLGLAGALPVGWLVAALSHLPAAGYLSGWRGGEYRAESELALLNREALSHVLYLTPGGGFPALLLWLIFGMLALLLPLTLLRARLLVGPDFSGAAASRVKSGADSGADSADLLDSGLRDSGVRLGAAWATLTPQALLAIVIGVSLSATSLSASPLNTSPRSPLALGVALLALAGLVAAAWWAWRHVHSPEDAAQDAEVTLSGTLSSSLTAGASGVAGALLVALLGARTEPGALAALAGTLLLVGLYGHSRLWVWLGAAGLALTALWGLGLPPATGLWSPLLPALPALFGLAGAIRAAQWRARYPWTPPLNWLAGLCSLVVVQALSGTSGWVTLVITLALCGAAYAIAESSGRRRIGEKSAEADSPVRHTLYWSALPGALLGGFNLLDSAGWASNIWSGSPRLAAHFPFLLGSLLAALTALLTARRAREGQPILELLGLGLLIGVLAALPGTGTPHFSLALALTALVAALLPLRLGQQRVVVLLGLGLLAQAWAWLAQSFSGWELAAGHLLNWPGLWTLLGAWVLLLVAWLTQDDVGRQWLIKLATGGLAARVFTQAREALLGLPRLSASTQTAWFATLLGVAVSSGIFLWPHGLPWWWLTGSIVVMGFGLVACVRAARADTRQIHEARSRWTTGLILVIAAGCKAALLDAFHFPNPAALMGLAVLVTGLSLLLLAVFAPRPRGTATVSVEE